MRATTTAVPGADTCRTVMEPFDHRTGKERRGAVVEKRRSFFRRSPFRISSVSGAEILPASRRDGLLEFLSYSIPFPRGDYVQRDSKGKETRKNGVNGAWRLGHRDDLPRHGNLQRRNSFSFFYTSRATRNSMERRGIKRGATLSYRYSITKRSRNPRFHSLTDSTPRGILFRSN